MSPISAKETPQTNKYDWIKGTLSGVDMRSTAPFQTLSNFVFMLIAERIYCIDGLEIEKRSTAGKRDVVFLLHYKACKQATSFTTKPVNKLQASLQSL